MILAVDCGNTHTVLGLINGTRNISQVFRIESNKKKTEFEYASEIERILEMLRIDPSGIEGVIISSVVPMLTDILKSALRLVTGKTALIVGAGIRTGLRIQIDDPGTVAGDLVTAAVAVKNEYPLPCFIIDMGTATTVTVVNQSGAYIGGVIMPGVMLSLNALTKETSLLPSIDLAPARKIIATSTQESMKAGILFGSAGALDGIIDRFIESVGEPASIVATGGPAATVCKVSRHSIIVDEHLLLKGLWYLWKNNQR